MKNVLACVFVGSFLYIPANQDACSRIEYDLTEHENILEIIHKGLRNFQGERQRNVYFLPSQVKDMRI